MKFLGSTERIIDKIKNGENVSKLGVVKIVQVQYNFIENQYKKSLKCYFINI